MVHRRKGRVGSGDPSSRVTWIIVRSWTDRKWRERGEVWNDSGGEARREHSFAPQTCDNDAAYFRIACEPLKRGKTAASQQACRTLYSNPLVPIMTIPVNGTANWCSKGSVKSFMEMFVVISLAQTLPRIWCPTSRSLEISVRQLARRVTRQSYAITIALYL